MTPFRPATAYAARNVLGSGGTILAIGFPPGTYGTLQNHVDFVLSGAGLVKPNWSIGIRATPTVPTIDVIPDDLDFGVVT